MAPVGSSPNVTGSRIARPADGPTPGITPTTMPIITPKTSRRTFCTVSRATTPVINSCMSHTSTKRQDALRQTDVEPGLEGEIQKDGDGDRDDHGADVVFGVEEPQRRPEE